MRAIRQADGARFAADLLHRHHVFQIPHPGAAKLFGHRRSEQPQSSKLRPQIAGNWLLRSISAARGWIFSSEKARTVLRNKSTLSPRPKSNSTMGAPAGAVAMARKGVLGRLDMGAIYCRTIRQSVNDRQCCIAALILRVHIYMATLFEPLNLEPAYRRVAVTIEGKIMARDLNDGDALPAELDLARAVWRQPLNRS